MGFKSGSLISGLGLQSYTGDISVCTCLNLREVVGSTEIFRLLEILLSQLIGVGMFVILDLLLTQC